MKKIKIFGKEIIEESAIKQLENCVSEDDIGVLTADAHLGYGHPIGGAVAYKNKISLSGVGFDIGCGNYCVKTSLNYYDIKDNLSKIVDEIFHKISFGVGRTNQEPVEHNVIDKISDSNISFQKNLKDLAYQQLGTVGSGNHFVDIFIDNEMNIWIGCHFGSRGFGHKTTMEFIKMSGQKEGSMESEPILFDMSSQIGQDYFEAMNLAGEYAYAGREIVINKILNILDTTKVFEVHNHHNFAWIEEHFGEKYYVVRKGCTPAFPDQMGFIGANMYDESVIIKGVERNESKEGLYSTVHGAGRIISRNKAAGKRKWKKGKKIKLSEGIVDWNKVKQMMIEKNIELRGAGADEAPECYKKLDDVLFYQGNTIEIIHRLKPIAVLMAPEEIFDPYKD